MSAAKKKASKRRASKATSKKKTAKKKQAAPANVPADWIHQAEAAALCRVSVTMFQRYDLTPAGKQGRYTYYSRDAVLDWIEQRAHKKGFDAGLREGKQAIPDDAGDLLVEQEKARLQLTRAQAVGQELKNAALKRELAPVAMVQWAISQAGSQIAAVLGTMKGRLKRAQPNLTNAALHEIEQMAVEVQNVAADVRLDWDEFDVTDLSDPRSD